MSALIVFLWLAGGVQIVIAFANLVLPEKLNYRKNLAKLSPIIRQVFVVHSAYVVGIVTLFAGLSFAFAGDLASGRGLGRFLAAAMSLFWVCRVPVQLFYYDASLRRQNRAGDLAFIAAAVFLATTYGAAALAHAS